MSRFEYTEAGSLQAFSPLNGSSVDTSWGETYRPMKIAKQDLIVFKKVYTFRKVYQNRRWSKYMDIPCIATLLIPKGSRVRVVMGKCRADKAYVMRIESLPKSYYDYVQRKEVQYGEKKYNEAVAGHDGVFKYTVGKMVYPKTSFEERAYECASGIHFFWTEEQAKGW